jgi:phosphate transport system permease protein
MMMSLYTRRIWTNRIGITLSMLAMSLGLIALMWILWTLFSKGFAALSWDLFTQDTPAPGSEGGGLRNAIVGSGLILLFSMLIATPVGILAGIYLAEYGRVSKFASLTRFMTDIMLSAPSIVIGLFVYALFVATTGGFSGWAGSLALALIAIPVVVRTTENMLKLVPTSLREAAFAVGAPRWQVSLKVTLRAVKSGVVTGVLLAMARITGETAPLLFTARDRFHRPLGLRQVHAAARAQPHVQPLSRPARRRRGADRRHEHRRAEPGRERCCAPRSAWCSRSRPRSR